MEESELAADYKSLLKAAIDERLRERTGGTCSMTPGTEPVKNIIRPPTFW